MTETNTLPPREAPVNHPGNAGDPTDPNGLWTYTSKAEDVVRLRQQFEARNGGQVRASIGRDTRLAEGVYEGSYGGEAIVVDYAREPRWIDAGANRAMRAAKDPTTGKIQKDLILESVFKEASTAIKYDADAVEKIFKDDLGGKDGAKISLGHYLKEGVGVCRHQALYAGAVLERLADLGIVGGQVSVDRNMNQRSGVDGKYDGHAWVRYTNSGGEVFILDVAQQKLGTLEEMMAAHAADPSRNWDYARPEDKQRQTGATTLGVMGVERPAGDSIEGASYGKDGVIKHMSWSKPTDTATGDKLITQFDLRQEDGKLPAGPVDKNALREKFSRDPNYQGVTIEAVGRLRKAMEDKLSSGFDYHSAVPEQSRRAMKAASMLIAFVTEAITNDPEAYGAINGYEGPVDQMAWHAARMHTRQTGHNLRGADFSYTRTTREEALRVLATVNQKVNDTKWDRTDRYAQEAEPVTAMARREIAREGLKALEAIAAQRGSAFVSRDLAASFVEFLIEG